MQFYISSQILQVGGAQVAQYTPKDLTQIDAKIINNLSMVSILKVYIHPKTHAHTVSDLNKVIVFMGYVHLKPKFNSLLKNRVVCLNCQLKLLSYKSYL